MNALVTLDPRPLTALSVEETRKPLGRLFASYQEPWADKGADQVERLRDAQVRAYMMGLDKMPGWAVEAAVHDFTSGNVERPARRIGVLPTVEELAKEGRRHIEAEAQRHHLRSLSRPPAERVPFMERVERKRRQFEHRAILFENVNYDEFRRLSRSGQVPVGGQWVVSLGTVYGPEPKP